MIRNFLRRKFMNKLALVAVIGAGVYGAKKYLQNYEKIDKDFSIC